MKLNKIDIVIMNIMLKICDILTKYTNNTTTTDVHVVRTLINEMEKNK